MRRGRRLKTCAAALLVVVVALAGCARSNVAAASLPELCQASPPEDILGAWRLERVNGEPWGAGEVTMTAEENALWGQLACNGYGTSSGPEGGARHYDIAEGRLVLLGDIVRTLRLCEDPARMDLEEQMVELLHGRPHVARAGDAMCLYTDEGMALEFRAVAPQDAQAG